MMKQYKKITAICMIVAIISIMVTPLNLFVFAADDCTHPIPEGTIFHADINFNDVIDDSERSFDLTYEDILCEMLYDDCDYICEVCGEYVTMGSDYKPHEYELVNYSINGEKADFNSIPCGTEYEETYRCKNCSDSYTLNLVKEHVEPASGVISTYDNVSCGETYTLKYTCDRTECKQSVVEEYTKEHELEVLYITDRGTFDEYDSVECGETYTMTYKCKSCGYSYSDDAVERDHEPDADVLYYLDEEEIDESDLVCETIYTQEFYCSNCGEFISRGYMIEHDPGKNEVLFAKVSDDKQSIVGDYVNNLSAIQCKSWYVKKYICEICGEEISEIAEEADYKDHNLIEIDAVDATCEEPGNKDYFVCMECDKKFADENAANEISFDGITIAAKGHSWDGGKVTKSATCVSDGLKEYTCVNDSNHTKTEVIPATDHNWGEWKVTKAATEDAEGQETRTCKNDSSHTETKAIPKLAHTHTLQKTSAKAATCTKAGNSEYYTCSGCGKYFSDAKGTKEITKDSWVLKAVGHTSEVVPAVAATCTKSGLTEGSKCLVCGEILKAQETVPALGHNWGEWKVTKAATEDAEGQETKICKNDASHVETRVIPKLEAKDVLKGDVNGDGDVNANDLTVLARHVAKIEVITDENLLKAADVTSEGSVDANDLTKLARYVAKIITSLE